MGNLTLRKHFQELTMRKQKGFALIWVLVFLLASLILAFAMTVLLTGSQKISGILKRYRSVLEASYGVVEISTSQMFDLLLARSEDPSAFQNFINDLGNNSINVTKNSNDTCLDYRLALQDSVNCTLFTDNPPTLEEIKNNADFIFDIANLYQVYFLISNRVKGNTETSGENLLTGGVAENVVGIVSGQHFPYVYEIEVLGEQSTGEKAHLSVLYIY